MGALEGGNVISQDSAASSRVRVALQGTAFQGTQLAFWRNRLAEQACLYLGLLCLVAAASAALWLQGLRGIWGPTLALGVGLVLLARLPHVHERVRSALLCLAFTAVVGIGGAHLGWSPSVVLASGILVVLTALLLGRVSMLLLVAVQFAALTWGADTVAPELSSQVTARLDPTKLANWLRVGSLFFVCTGTLGLLMQHCASLISLSLARVSLSHHRTEELLAAAAKARKQRLAAQYEMRHEQKLQSVAQLSGGLAQLLNNALMAVLGAVSELRRDSSLSARQAAADSISQATMRVARALRQLMVFSRNEAEPSRSLDLKVELERLLVDWKDALPDTLELHLAAQAEVEVLLDPDQLRQLVLCLLLNSADAMPRGGRAQVTVRRLSVGTFPGSERCPYAEIVVEDTGCGMSAEQIERAADAFYTTKAEAAHVGLGLTLATAIAERAGGYLQLESVPSIGTRVRVRLPCNLIPAGASAAKALELLHSDSPLIDEGCASSIPSTQALSPSSQSGLAEHGAVVVEDWKSQVTRRIARLMAVAGTLAVASGLLRNLTLTWSVAVCMFGGLGALFTAGWLRCSSRHRVLLLTLGLATSTVVGLAAVSFVSPALLTALSMAVVWSSLLGTKETARLTLVLVSTGFIVIGYLYTRGEAPAPPLLLRLDDPGSWHTAALSLSLIQLALGVSVLAIVGHAERSLEHESQQEQQLREASREQEREHQRMLIVQHNRSRSERLAATGRAVGSVAHDLNNALQSLLIPCAELGIRNLSSDHLATLLSELTLSVEQARVLTLRFGHPPHAAALPQPIVDVGLVLNAFQPSMKKMLSTGVDFVSTIAEGVFVAISPTSLQRVVFNLVSNASDAIQGAGTVRLTLRQERGEAELIVEDDGSGMDAAVSQRVFDPFFTTKEAGKGTGLGLHSVREIVSQTGGRIEVDSKPGSGSRFHIRWPVSSSPMALEPLAAPAPADIEDSPKEEGQVLVVEDEAQILQYMETTLRRCGFTVTAVGSGERAAEALQTGAHYDALCIDGVIPGRSSKDVISLFRASNPHGPIFLCSGHLPSEVEARGLLEHDVTFVPKPFYVEDLSKRILEQLKPSSQPAPARRSVGS